MTNERAIERLKEIYELIRYAKILKTTTAGLSEEYYDETQDAIKIALKVLNQPKQKNDQKFIEIVAECPPIRPYFSIRYEENGETFEGFGTYSPAVLSDYIREHFICDRVEEEQ